LQIPQIVLLLQNYVKIGNFRGKKQALITWIPTWPKGRVPSGCHEPGGWGP